MNIVKMIDLCKGIGQCRRCGRVYRLPKNPRYDHEMDTWTGGALPHRFVHGAFTKPPCGCHAEDLVAPLTAPEMERIAASPRLQRVKVKR